MVKRSMSERAFPRPGAGLSFKAAEGAGGPVIPFKAVKRQNILIVSSLFPPHVFGGAEVAAYNRAKLLTQRGHNVSVMTLYERNLPAAWGDLSPEGFRIYRVETPRGYTLFERTQIKSRFSKIFWHFQDYFDARNKELMNAVLDHSRPDHVEIDNIMGIGFNALQEIGRRNIPAAYILHDLNLACINTGMIKKGKQCKRQCVSCRGIAVLRQRNLERIRNLGFISPSRANLERAKKVISRVAASPVCVNRNVPEELPLLPERKCAGHIRLLFAGRLHPDKGIGFLLRTLDDLSDIYDFHLTILGKGPSEWPLKVRYGKKKWVTFRGFVPEEEVVKIIAASDLCCIPSLVSESYGLVTAHALRLGTPVIGSNAGGTAELVRDGVTGILPPPGDMQAWKEAFLKIFSDRKLLAEWRENAAGFSSEFNKDAIGKAHEAFIESLAFKSYQ